MEMEVATIISRASRNCNFMHVEEMFYDVAYNTPLFDGYWIVLCASLMSTFCTFVNSVLFVFFLFWNEGLMVDELWTSIFISKLNFPAQINIKYTNAQYI